MRILYIVQQSIYNNEGKWSSADSNPMMTAGIVDQFLKLSDWDIDIMLAPEDTFFDIKNHRELLIEDNLRVNFISRKGPVSAFTNRYHFDAEFFRKVFLAHKYDVVINNIIELTRNIKTVLWELNQHPKLIVGNYWIDAPAINEEKVPQAISYDWRQIDGAECADLVSFTCPSTKKAFEDNARKRVNTYTLQAIKNKSTIWDFGFSAFELDRYKIPGKMGKKIVLFPNRLSGINYTHHEEFIEVVNSIYEKRQDFQVVFTNPSQKISWEWLKENVKPLLVISEEPLSRGDYIRLLWRSDIIVSLYTVERYGGCANVEGLYCECYPVMTDFGEYIYRSIGSTELVHRTLTDLPRVLETALDTCREEPAEMARQRKEYVYNSSSYEVVSDVVIRDIERLIST